MCGVNENSTKNCAASKNFEELEINDVLENIRLLLNYIKKRNRKGASLISSFQRRIILCAHWEGGKHIHLCASPSLKKYWMARHRLYFERLIPPSQRLRWEEMSRLYLRHPLPKRQPRPLALPLLSVLIFCGGDLKKGMGRQRRGAAFVPQNRIYQTGIFHNRLYHTIILMAKKHLPKYQKLTAKLRVARLEANLTQVEAGKKLRKPQAYLSKIERGERGVDAVELGELAKVYGKSLDYFIKQ